MAKQITPSKYKSVVTVYRDPNKNLLEFGKAMNKFKDIVNRYNLKIKLDYINYTPGNDNSEIFKKLADNFQLSSLYYYPSGQYINPMFFNPKSATTADEIYTKLMEFIVVNESDQELHETLKKIAIETKLPSPIFSSIIRN